MSLPVCASRMNNTASPLELLWPSATVLLYPLPNTTPHLPSCIRITSGWLNVLPRSASCASVNSHMNGEVLLLDVYESGFVTSSEKIDCPPPARPETRSVCQAPP